MVTRFSRAERLFAHSINIRQYCAAVGRRGASPQHSGLSVRSYGQAAANG